MTVCDSVDIRHIPRVQAESPDSRFQYRFQHLPELRRMLPTEFFYVPQMAVKAGQNDNQRMGNHRDGNGQSDQPHVSDGFPNRISRFAKLLSSVCAYQITVMSIRTTA